MPLIIEPTPLDWPQTPVINHKPVEKKKSYFVLFQEPSLFISADDTLFYFYFYLSKKIRFDVSSESSARQRIHIKCQALFSLKNNEKVFMNVICCIRDWRFEG